MNREVCGECGGLLPDHSMFCNAQPGRAHYIAWCPCCRDYETDNHAEKCLVGRLRARYAEAQTALAEARKDAELLHRALAKLEWSVDWFLGRSPMTQSNELKGIVHSEQVRKDLFDAHDAARSELSRYAAK